MILKVHELKKYFLLQRGMFGVAHGVVKAVDGVSFSLEDGAVLGIVGESGCGKTTLAKLILRLEEPTGGEIVFGPQITNLRRNTGIVFQDPLLSLNPRMRIGDILREPLIIHGLRKDKKRISGIIDLVGLEDNLLNRYPAALSGGQRQRVCIARALIIEPKLLILDEPVSSLDLIIQRQIIDLLLDLRSRLKISYIFISHNIALVKEISTDIIVMLNGKAVEQGIFSEVFLNPQSDYTKKLLVAAR